MSAAAVPSPVKKTKMISFRVSGEEYLLLQKTCSTSGARSVSELARAAMQRIILEAGTGKFDTTEAKLRDLQMRFNVLAAEVQRLTRLIQTRQENTSL